MEQHLIVENISKNYKDVKALVNVNLTLTNGLYGLLGANGAGKSTLIKIIVGLEKQNVGNVEYLIDNEQRVILENIGYLPQYPMFYPEFTPVEFLDYMMKIKIENFKKNNIKENIDILLDKVNLKNVRNKKIQGFSGGMRQRLGIAQALIGNPNILIFDEPTAGLDLKERIEFRNIITSLSGDKIIIFATHIVSDVESIAKDIIFLDKGSIVDKGIPSNLSDKLKGKVWNINVNFNDIDKYMGNHIVSNISENKEGFTLKIISDYKPTENAVETNPNLEDYCMYMYRSM